MSEITTTTTDQSKQLAAVSPAELQQAQQKVSAHCDARIASLQGELDEAKENEQRAVQAHYAAKPFRRLARRLERKIEYFEKIKAAVDKGYLIIPDVWAADIFAVRVKDKDSVRWDRTFANIEKLPLGQGEYINHHAGDYDRLEYEDGNGRKHTQIVDQKASDVIEFPVSVVNPAVLDATQIAMADKVFDTMSIARQGGDPFILGEIRDPAGNYRSVTFFIAWFLDLKHL